MRVYLDYAASTPVAPEVFKAMKPYFSDKFGSPSSIHSFGREAEIATDEAREVVSRFFGVDFGEVYFTSGATEANNWIINIATSYKLQATSHKPHIITSVFEHESILEPTKHLEKKGFIEATYLSPSREGFIDPNEVKLSLKQNTVLVSIMYVNNEIGTVQPIKEIGRIIEKHQRAYKLQATSYKLPLFHTDAVQAIQFFEPRLEYLKVDAITVSAHKMYGPKGVGALIVRKFIPPSAFLYGGAQEFEKRAGTLNVPAIVGFGKAIEVLQETRNKKQETKRIGDLKEKLKIGILRSIPNIKIVAEKEPIAPHILNVIFEDIESQVMLIALDGEGIAVSSGAACSVKSIKPSHVTASLGYSESEASHSVRFSFGRYTTEEEIDFAIAIISKVIKKFKRKFA